MSDHWFGCWENENHPACRLERIRVLEKENRRLIDERIVSALVHHEMTQTGPIVTHATFIPCDDPYFTHHGDEPPSSTL